VRGLISFVVIAVTVIIQLTIVDRISFPGGAGPNLVLLAVAALALAGGPLTGVLIGFWAGLALDVAPPGSHFVGQDALVFCLIGYACGLLADDSSGDAAEQGHTALFEIVVTAAGAVCGEVLAALLGVMLSDPRVTWPAIKNVLPAAVAYDVLLCPFVLYAVAAALRLAGARGEGRRAGWSGSQARDPVPGANQGAIRQLAGGDVLRLRVSDRDKGSGAVGGLRGPGAGRPAARREPRLKLGRAGPRSSTATYRDGPGAGPSRVRFGGRRREGVLGGSLLGSASPGGAALRGSGLGGSGLGGSMFGSSSMGRSLLGGSVFSRSSSALGVSSALGHSSSRFGRSTAFGHSSSRFGRSTAFGRSAPSGRSSPLRHRGNLMRSVGGGLAGHAPRFSRGGSLTRLTGAPRGSTGPKSPGRGWLRGASSPGHSPGRNAQGGTSLSRGAFGRRRMGRDFRGLRGLRGLRGFRVWGGPSTPRLKAARTGSVRLRMPRPKAKRRWRTGGYR
jgi:rod shape-determining protein MreD